MKKLMLKEFTSSGLSEANVPQDASPEEHCTDLIKRIKQAVVARRRVDYNPETGCQRWYLDGKLIAVKYVKGSFK